MGPCRSVRGRELIFGWRRVLQPNTYVSAFVRYKVLFFFYLAEFKCSVNCHPIVFQYCMFRRNSRLSLAQNIGNFLKVVSNMYFSSWFKDYRFTVILKFSGLFARRAGYRALCCRGCAWDRHCTESSQGEERGLVPVLRPAHGLDGRVNIQIGLENVKDSTGISRVARKSAGPSSGCRYSFIVLLVFRLVHVFCFLFAVIVLHTSKLV